MCITLFAYDVHPKYKLILSNNRDELQVRPTATADFWNDTPSILAGRDLTAKGTWLGINRNGRLGNITNYRDFRIPQKENAPSRGDLPTQFLNDQISAEEYLERLAPEAEAYNGFSILLGDGDHLAWFSNMEGEVRTLDAGIYGFSNALLDTPWPKVEKGKAFFNDIADHTDWTSEDLLRLMADQTPGPDHLLPDTGKDIEFERVVSPIFVANSFYGTRASSVLLVDREGKVDFIERSYDMNAIETGTVKHTFRIG